MRYKDQNPSTQLLYVIITLILTSTTNQKKNCIVDQCARCRYVNLDSCDKCNSGYYKRTWFGESKGRDYNACWSIWKLALGLLTSLALMLSYLYCCYKCWQKGKRTTKIVNTRKPTHTVQDNRKMGGNGGGAPNMGMMPSSQRNLNMPTQTSLPPMNQQYGGNMHPQAPYKPPPPPPPPPAPYSPSRRLPPIRRSVEPSTTIVRERPTTIIREVSPNHSRLGGSPRRRPSARIVRYEPDSLRGMGSPRSRASRVGSPVYSPSRSARRFY